MWSAARGDLGVSIQSRHPVNELLFQRLAFTLQLSLVSILVASTIGLVARIISSTRQYSIFDTTSMLVALFGISMPIFCLGLLLILIMRCMDILLAFPGIFLALWSGNSRVMFRHLLPNCMASIIVQSTLRMATVLLTASGLSFLGLGVQPPTPEWGAMLSNARSYLIVAPHVATIPGLAIMVVVVGFNLFGDGLCDTLDPRLRQ